MHRKTREDIGRKISFIILKADYSVSNNQLFASNSHILRKNYLSQLFQQIFDFASENLAECLKVIILGVVYVALPLFI